MGNILFRGNCLEFEYKKSDGVYVGQLIKVPAIIVQGRSLYKMKTRLKTALEGYMEAFPSDLSL